MRRPLGHRRIRLTVHIVRGAISKRPEMPPSFIPPMLAQGRLNAIWLGVGGVNSHATGSRLGEGERWWDFALATVPRSQKDAVTEVAQVLEFKVVGHDV